jgi:hypothetical protein
MAIELIPLCTARIDTAPPLRLDTTPLGNRAIYDITGIRYTGERLNASLRGAAAADWLVVGADGMGVLDVRYTLETDDGALVFVAYGGRWDTTAPTELSTVYAAPLFETGDPRYAWLNGVQAVAKGSMIDGVIRYEMYEVR